MEYDYDQLHVEIDNMAEEMKLEPFEALETWHLGCETFKYLKAQHKRFLREEKHEKRRSGE